jgi:macrolide-specific efflux system membrane fusion protein
MKKAIQKYLKEILSDRKKTIAVVLILIVLGFLGYRTFGKEEAAPQIQAAQVEKGTIISSVTASGTVNSSNIENVTTQASGTVRKVYVSDGDEVSVGQKLAEINLDVQGEQNYLSASSSYVSAQNSLNSANNSYRQTQASLAVVYDEIKGHDTDETLEMKETRTRAEVANDNAYDGIKTAQVRLSSAAMTLKTSSPTITSPVAGTIKSVTIAEGMNIGAAETASGARANQRIATIGTKGLPIATFNVSEIDVSLVKPGQKATITIDSLPDITFTGKVVSVDRVGTATSGVVNYPVIIKFDTGSDQILPNMTASVSIIIESKNDVLLVPSSAVQTQAGQSTVKVLRNGQQETVSVKIGLISDTQTEIVSGLSEGDTVITGTVSSGQTLQGEGSPFGGFGGAGRIFR